MAVRWRLRFSLVFALTFAPGCSSVPLADFTMFDTWRASTAISAQRPLAIFAAIWRERSTRASVRCRYSALMRLDRFRHWREPWSQRARACWRALISTSMPPSSGRWWPSPSEVQTGMATPQLMPTISSQERGTAAAGAGAVSVWPSAASSLWLFSSSLSRLSRGSREAARRSPSLWRGALPSEHSSGRGRRLWPRPSSRRSPQAPSW